MNERLKAIRTHLQLTQLAFSEKLNVSKSTIEALEYGRRELTDRMIKDICREFDINEKWLRTGEGQMIEPLDRNTEIARLVANMKKTPDSMKSKLTLLLQQVDDDTIALMYDIAKQWVNEVEGKDDQ